jgi:hypothetical protein
MRRWIGLVAAGLLACFVAACGGDSPDDSGARATTTTAAESTTTSPATTTTGGSTTTSKAAGEGDVDLRFTGTYVLQIKGRYGDCTGTGGTFAFSMSAKDADGMGEAFTVKQVATGSPITWKVDSVNSYESSGSAGTTFSSDGTSVRIDVDLTRVDAPSGAPPRPEHVAGTITCP